ncbi:hypothetical protein N7G274_007753 [Stereocaulon virgatum]|uniref:FHA domain-containing protein n=1 Tax=Stereocaulon virgatum TaxID=373712 RepID=A0ABR4A3E9_9LECA
MPISASNRVSKQGHRRRHSSDAEDDIARHNSASKRRSPDHARSSYKSGGKENLRSRSDYTRRHRSRSPRDYRFEIRRRYSSDSESPGRRPGNHEEDRRHSKQDRGFSQSPPPKRRRSDSREYTHRRTHRRDSRKASPSIRRSASPTRAPTLSKRSHAPLPSQKDAFTNDSTSDAVKIPPPEPEKQKPNYAPTGKLAAETNTVANTTIVLKYNEPPEARLPPPSHPWRLYIFKGPDVLETLPLHERSCWLFGRERAVVDFATEHPSCSKQHAVIQFRYVEKKNEWGEKKGAVKPYVIDLESANGTKVNGEKLPDRQFLELRSGDVVVFGDSTREYVLMLPPKEEKKP